MAEKRIFPYLQGNKYNGIMFNLSKKLLVVCYADADFQDCEDTKILKTLFVLGLKLGLL